MVGFAILGLALAFSSMNKSGYASLLMMWVVSLGLFAAGVLMIIGARKVHDTKKYFCNDTAAAFVYAYAGIVGVIGIALVVLVTGWLLAAIFAKRDTTVVKKVEVVQQPVVKKVEGPPSTVTYDQSLPKDPSPSAPPLSPVANQAVMHMNENTVQNATVKPVEQTDILETEVKTLAVQAAKAQAAEAQAAKEAAEAMALEAAKAQAAEAQAAKEAAEAMALEAAKAQAAEAQAAKEAAEAMALEAAKAQAAEIQAAKEAAEAEVLEAAKAQAAEIQAAKQVEDLVSRNLAINEVAKGQATAIDIMAQQYPTPVQRPTGPLPTSTKTPSISKSNSIDIEKIIQNAARRGGVVESPDISLLDSADKVAAAIKDKMKTIKERRGSPLQYTIDSPAKPQQATYFGVPDQTPLLDTDYKEIDGGEIDGGEIDGGEIDGGEIDGGALNEMIPRDSTPNCEEFYTAAIDALDNMSYETKDSTCASDNITKFEECSTKYPSEKYTTAINTINNKCTRSGRTSNDTEEQRMPMTDNEITTAVSRILE